MKAHSESGQQTENPVIRVYGSIASGQVLLLFRFMLCVSVSNTLTFLAL